MAVITQLDFNTLVYGQIVRLIDGDNDQGFDGRLAYFREQISPNKSLFYFYDNLYPVFAAPVNVYPPHSGWKPSIASQIADPFIHSNRNAPADRLIRTLYNGGAYEVLDLEDNSPLPTFRDAIERWYNLDELVFRFTLPAISHTGLSKPRRGVIHLIHQEHFGKPRVEDISNFSSWLSGVPFLRNVLNLDWNRVPVYFGGGFGRQS